MEGVTGRQVPKSHPPYEKRTTQMCAIEAIDVRGI